MCSAARPLGFDDDTMERYFQRAIADNSDYYQVYWSKLMHLAPKWGGSTEAMLTFAKQTAENAPRDSALLGILTDAHEEIGWYIMKDAKQYYNIPEVWSEIKEISMQLMENFPQSGIWASRYAVFAHHAGKLEEAQKYHDLALKLDPNAFEVRYERGRFFHYYQKNLYRALQEYTEALKLQPYSLKVLYRKASILFDRQQWLKALKAYSKLIEVEPHNAQNYYNRGSVHVRLRQYRQAIQDYTQSITLDPEYKLAYKWRAACYERLGMVEEQKRDLRVLESLSQ
jgi:tetratricopeptide (TPR) repeat protein